LILRSRKRVKTIVELLIDTPSESLKEDLLETEQKLKPQTTQKAELEKALNTAKVRHSNLVLSCFRRNWKRWAEELPNGVWRRRTALPR
jgi:hypothetical protein